MDWRVFCLEKDTDCWVPEKLCLLRDKSCDKKGGGSQGVGVKQSPKRLHIQNPLYSNKLPRISSPSNEIVKQNTILMD